MLTRSGKLYDSEDLILRQTFSGSKVIYEGRAAPGTADSDEGWQIKFNAYDGNNKVSSNFAEGTNELIHVWDDRASYSYS